MTQEVVAQTSRKSDSKLAGSPIPKPGRKCPSKTSFSLHALINPRHARPATARAAPKQPTSARAKASPGSSHSGSSWTTPRTGSTRTPQPGFLSARSSGPPTNSLHVHTPTSAAADGPPTNKDATSLPFRPSPEQVLVAREILRCHSLYNARPGDDGTMDDDAPQRSQRYITAHMCTADARRIHTASAQRRQRRRSPRSCSPSRLGSHATQHMTERSSCTSAGRCRSTSPIRAAHGPPSPPSSRARPLAQAQQVHVAFSAGSHAQVRDTSRRRNKQGWDVVHRSSILSHKSHDTGKDSMALATAPVESVRSTVVEKMRMTASLLQAVTREKDEAAARRSCVTEDEHVTARGGKQGAHRATSSRSGIHLPSRDVSQGTRRPTILDVHDLDNGRPLSSEHGWTAWRAPRCHARSLERTPPHNTADSMAAGLSWRGSHSCGLLRVDRMTRKPSTLGSTYNWLSVSVRANGLTGEKLLDILESKKHLRFLDAQSNQLDADAPVTIMHEFPRLRHLDVSSNPKIGSDGLVRLCRDRETLRLQSLMMANCHLGDEKEGGQALGAFLQHSSCRLVKLDLSFNNLGVAFCDLLAQGLEQNRTVRSINLERSLAYSNHTMEYLLSFETPVHFQELNFARNNLSFEALEALVRFLDRTRVDVLNLSRTNLQNPVITKALRKMRVSTFILVGCRLPESPDYWPFGTEETLLDGVFPMEEPQIQSLGAIFSRRQHILSLSQHKYGSLFCQHLTRRIPIPLLQLTLDHSLLHDEGVKNLHLLHTINSLSVQYNHLTAAGAEYLMPLLGMQLQYLNLGGNKLRREGALVLSKHLSGRSVDDFTLGVHQTLLTQEGIAELWNCIVQRPLEALDLRRSQLKHPLSKILPLIGDVTQVEVDLRDNPALNNENDLCEWAMQMTKVHTDLPLSAVWACRMLEKSPSLVLKEPRMHMLNRGITQILRHTSVQINLDDNQLWRAKTASREVLKSLSPRPSPSMYVKYSAKKEGVTTPDKNAQIHTKQQRRSSRLPAPARRSTACTAQRDSSKSERRTSQRKASLLSQKTPEKIQTGHASTDDTRVGHVVQPAKVLSALKSLRRLILRKLQIRDADTFAQVFGFDSKALHAVRPDLANSKLSTRGAEYVAYCRRYGVEGLILDSTFIATFGLAMLLGDSSTTESQLMRHSCHIIGDLPGAPILRVSNTHDNAAQSDLESPITAGDLLALSRAVAGLPARHSSY
eukprot:GEMP01002202.1.p1 GENE.GEMP01002202.1~~GEMP01002202.1.p1  ORF type:complete len:1221 (+),score=264.40 GEMP01002202.1:87-3749(+)